MVITNHLPLNCLEDIGIKIQFQFIRTFVWIKWQVSRRHGEINIKVYKENIFWCVYPCVHVCTCVLEQNAKERGSSLWLKHITWSRFVSSHSLHSQTDLTTSFHFSGRMVGLLSIVRKRQYSVLNYFYLIF